MAIISKPNTPQTGGTISAPDTNSNLDTIYNDYNGNITTANISASAAIANSKLNLASIAQAVALAGGLTMTARQIDEAKGANLAAVAGTTPIWVTDGNFLHITGAETITSFGTAAQAGIERTLVFDGACVLTHNATSLILPGAANITTSAGDRAIVRAETTANARVIAYTKADGTALVASTLTISSKVGSTTRDVSTASGTQAITGIGFQPKAVILIAGIAAANNEAVSIGVDDGTTGICIFNGGNDSANTWGFETAKSISIHPSAAGNNATASVTTLGADGFTLTWVKTGSPTGTYNIGYLCIK